MHLMLMPGSQCSVNDSKQLIFEVLFFQSGKFLFSCNGIVFYLWLPQLTSDANLTISNGNRSILRNEKISAGTTNTTINISMLQRGIYIVIN